MLPLFVISAILMLLCSRLWSTSQMMNIMLNAHLDSWNELRLRLLSKMLMGSIWVTRQIEDSLNVIWTSGMKVTLRTSKLRLTRKTSPSMLSVSAHTIISLASLSKRNSTSATSLRSRLCSLLVIMKSGVKDSGSTTTKKHLSCRPSSIMPEQARQSKIMRTKSAVNFASKIALMLMSLCSIARLQRSIKTWSINILMIATTQFLRS